MTRLVALDTILDMLWAQAGEPRPEATSLQRRPIAELPDVLLPREPEVPKKYVKKK